MTGLRSTLERYLSMRQGLGYKYQHQARRLADFVWPRPSPRNWRWPGRHCHPIGTHPGRAVDRRALLRAPPPAGILPPLKRAKPYVYSDAEIDALLAAALALPPANGLRRWTYHYLVGLTAVIIRDISLCPASAAALTSLNTMSLAVFADRTLFVLTVR
jgi:hypothetical protein